MDTIFISFRRRDTHDFTWRFFHYLKNYQDQRLVYDFDMNEAGDFRETIRRVMDSAVVVIVLVGQKWLDDASAEGISSPGTWVQAEIEWALAAGTPILPVLVHDSSMPEAECLPETIREFAYQQAASVRSDAHFDDDMKRVCTMLDQLAPSRSSAGLLERFAPRLFRRD